LWHGSTLLVVPLARFDGRLDALRDASTGSIRNSHHDPTAPTTYSARDTR
jgi:hypothetical protein